MRGLRPAKPAGQAGRPVPRPDAAAAIPTEDRVEALGELRAIRFFLGGLFLLALLGAVYYARALLLPIVVAVLVALTLRPVVRWAAKYGVPAPLTGVSIIVAFGFAAAAAIYAASGPVANLVERAPAIGAEVEWKLRGLLDQLGAVQRAAEQAEDLASGNGGGDAAADEEPTEVVVQQSGLLTQVVGSLANVGTSLAVALILAAFLLSSGDFYHRRIVESVNRLQDKKRAYAIVRDVERQMSRYLAAITTINAGLGLCIGLALWMIGLPYAYMWGIAGFLLNYLPFLGAIGGAFGVGMVALVTFDDVGRALACPLAYYTLTTLEGQFVTPYFLGRQLAINTVSVFVTVLVWVWLWGIAGAFLAVPVLVVIKVLADNVPGWGKFSRFLGSSRE